MKDKMTRELTKEVKDMDRENNEVSELVAVLALVQLEVVREAMDIVGRLTRWSRRWPSFSEPKLTPGAPAYASSKHCEYLDLKILPLFVLA